MKKFLWISGIITVLLLPVLLTGMADADASAKNALARGNLRYESAEYGEALSLYEAGLAENPENKALCFNAAQAAYKLGDYEKAAGYYEKSDGSTEMFLNFGNANTRLGDACTDESLKIQFYTRALQTYREGIVEYPRDIPLKYNYEAVKRKLEDSQSQSSQDQENQDQENQDQENQDQEDGEQGDSDSSQENSDRSSQDSDEQAGEQEAQDESSESNQEEQAQENQAQDSETDDEQGSEAEEQEASGQPEAEAEAEQNREAIEQILNMLESQEEESLKNNREVVGGKEGKNDW